jgi:hypothetical protein
VAKLTGAREQTLIFDDSTTLRLPPCYSVECKGTVLLIRATRGRLTQVAIAPVGAPKADVERHLWQTLDDLNRAGWWQQG